MEPAGIGGGVPPLPALPAAAAGLLWHRERAVLPLWGAVYADLPADGGDKRGAASLLQLLCRHRQAAEGAVPFDDPAGDLPDAAAGGAAPDLGAGRHYVRGTHGGPGRLCGNAAVCAGGIPADAGGGPAGKSGPVVRKLPFRNCVPIE